MAKQKKEQKFDTPALLNIEDAQLIWRNFSGKGGGFNAEGNRNFSVVLDEDQYQDLALMNWRVKTYVPKNDDEPLPPIYSLNVKVNFNSNRPPKIYLITESSRAMLDEDSIDILDFADIVTADLVINPYYTETALAGAGFSAYLQTAYITIREDKFASKYANVPTSAIAAITGER